ncbi:protein-L-isoaspartate(D-aspartate) O-methyltransferase [Streptomyces sp. NPDC092296]|uniref:protein-L-isoaspartate(D-aspartate) O-methyltransferase n=1 Tax=Streptomyces sp. NPDC092296 TaxID=3366012 RepID=UPI003802C82D
MIDRSMEQRDRAGDELTRFLLDIGSLTPDWVDCFKAVPRALLLPALVWAFDMATGQSVAVDKADDPDEWLRQTFANVPLVTQWDDGKHEGNVPGAVPTSSASMPSVVASMLRDLDVRPGMRALEIGTGPGWTAGLLSHRLGSENVVSVEVDAHVAAEARTALARVGLHPEIVRANGEFGWQRGAPYDRVIVTAGVRRIPVTWLRQTRPDGVILAPWGTDYDSNGDVLVKLTVNADGSASGPFLRPVEFMKLRGQRLDWNRFRHHVPAYPGDAHRSTTRLGPDDLGGRYGTARFIAGLCVPNCAHVTNQTDAATTQAWFFDLSGRSWANAVFRQGAPSATVYQSGPRRLWDEVERALSWWQTQGQPELTQFGLTIHPDGTQHPWLTTPTNPLPSP